VEEKPEAVVAEGSVEIPSQSNPEETNVWPTEAEEVAFLAESRGQNAAASVAVQVQKPESEDADENSKPLPKLDELVNRIPADARELLEDLFRAKFTTVRRVKKRDLKSPT
jgi:hypothetical protein